MIIKRDQTMCTDSGCNIRLTNERTIIVKLMNDDHRRSIFLMNTIKQGCEIRR